MESRIIKGTRVLSREAQEAFADAEHIRQEASEQAAAILASAESEREAIAAEARDAGYRAGLASWNERLEQADTLMDRIARDGQYQLLRLSIRVAEKIIGEQLRIAPETIGSIVGEALKSARRDRRLLLRVHPEHQSQVRGTIDRLRESAADDREFRVVADPAVKPGGCVIESELGTIDAQLDVQLKVLEELMLRTKK